LQNEPVGREEVSIGTGIAGADSTIFFMGRAISIRFFGGGALVISIRWGACAGGCGGDGGCDDGEGSGAFSVRGAGWDTGRWTVVVIFWRSALTQSSLSRLRSPPLVLLKVRTIWRVLPLMVMMEIVMVGSRIAFSPLSTSFKVARLISWGGMECFFVSMRTRRRVVRTTSNDTDFTLTFCAWRTTRSSLYSSG
jgi:hypothetical protein